MKVLSKTKDKLVSKLSKKAVNRFLKKYGKIEDFSLDSILKKLEIGIRLNGENDVLKIIVEKYALIENRGKSFIQIDEVNTSKVWLNTVINQYIKGKTFEVPSRFAGLIKATI